MHAPASYTVAADISVSRRRYLIRIIAQQGYNTCKKIFLNMGEWVIAALRRVVGV